MFKKPPIDQGPVEVVCRNCDWQGTLDLKPSAIQETLCERCLLSRLKVVRHRAAFCWGGAKGFTDKRRRLANSFDNEI